jgi:Bacterial PH domain
VIADKTVILNAGAVTRTTTAFPLVNLTGMTLERTATGRLTGFGAFRLGANSPVQLVIDYVPYPEQLYLQIRERIRAELDEAASG